MQTRTNCLNCDPCLSVNDINRKLINIADNRLYNIRYELNRPVDYDLFRLLIFYKDAAVSICEGTTYGCYSGGVDKPCQPCKDKNYADCNDCEEETSVTEQNIIERIRILTA